MSSLKDFVEYIDNIFYQEPKDVNAIKNSVEIFFEFFKKKEFEPENVFFLRLMIEKIKDDSKELNDEMVLMLAGCFWGMCLDKFSEKEKIENYEL